MRLSATRLTSIAQAGGGRTLIQRAISILRRFGSDAHIYLPGVGMLNGLQAGNYLDSAGTTPGTVDQPVGLVLDAGGGLGVELVTNGDFSAGITGWSGDVTAPAGVGVITSTGAGYPSASSSLFATEVGKTYSIKATIARGTGAWNLKARARTSANAELVVCNTVISTDMTEVFAVFTATTTSTRVQVYADNGSTVAGQTAFVWETSVREVTGIAASQPTTASKPILRRGAVNLLTYSGDFGNAAWQKAGTATAPNASTVNTPAVNDYVFEAVSAATYAGKVVTVAYMLSGSGTVAIGSYDNISAFQLDTITLTATPTLYTKTLTFGTGAADIRCLVGRIGAVTATTFSGAGAALFAGTYTAQQIQALGGIPLTTTAPASTALGPMHWSFDGSNDSLSLGGPLFQMADDHCVVAGASITGTTAANYLFSVKGDVYLTAGGLGFNNKKPWASWYDGPNSVTITHGVAQTGAVVVAALKSGSSKLLRVNGVQSGPTNTTAMNAVALTNAYIGGSSSTVAATLDVGYSHNGAIYPVIAIKGTVTDPDLLLLEKFVANLSGVTL